MILLILILFFLAVLMLSGYYLSGYILYKNYKFDKACERGDIEYINFMLKQKSWYIDIHSKMKQAIRDRQLEVVKLLVAYTDLKDTGYLNKACRYHPFWHLFNNKQEDMINLLIEKGATCNSDSDNYYIKEYLKYRIHKELFKLYLESEKENKHFSKKIIKNVIKNGCKDLVKLLLEHGKITVDEILKLSAEFDQLEIFEDLLENNNISEEELYYIFKISIRNKSIKIVEFLTQKKGMKLKENNYDSDDSDNDVIKIIKLGKLLAE